MIDKNNERGGALLLVLMLVVVFTVIGMGLLTMNISASKQFSKKEEQVQARHLAEMGVLHYKAEVAKMVEEHNTSLNLLKTNPPENLRDKIDAENNLFCINLEDENKIFEEINITKRSEYQVELAKIICQTNEITISITSEGFSKSNIISNIDAEFTIKLPEIDSNDGSEENIDNGEIIPPPPPPTGNVKDEYGTFKILNGPIDTYATSIHIKEGVQIGNNGKKNIVKGLLTVESGNNGGGTDATFAKDLYIDGGIYIQNHACVVIKGNLTVTESIDLSKNHTSIIVFGNANLPVMTEKQNPSNIHVIGDVFINGVKQAEKPNDLKYDTKAIESSGCSLPDTGNQEGSKDVEGSDWELIEVIKATYSQKLKEVPVAN